MEESIIKTEEGNKNGYSIANVYEAFLNFRQRRVSTLKLYNYAFRLFVDFIGTDSVLIENINSMQMSNFINWLGENYAGNSGYVVYCIIKSLFNFADKHYFITINPLNMVDTRRRLSRHHHHQALTDQQMAICENDFWHSFDTSANGVWQRDMLTDTKSDAFFRMCFILGYYLQGLALVDVLSLKVEQVKLRKVTGESLYVVETNRRKTGKGVKIVIPENHANRYRLFTLMYESAVNSGREHLLPVLDSLGDDELYIYNKVNRLNCDLSRKLKQWWRQLNKCQLRRNPIDIKSTSYYSCRHTFATLYLQAPTANISELATLMRRNTEYIDTYIREIESDQIIGNASDKVYGRKKRQEEDNERKQILKNQKMIIEMQKQILERLSANSVTL